MPSSKQPTTAQKAAVAAAFDPDALRDACHRDAEDFPLPRYDLPPSPTGRPRFYYYRQAEQTANIGPNSGPNSGRVLAVAHLDTVQPDRTLSITRTPDAGLLATSGGLDDRLGVYVILHLLPALGIHTDILLTTDEEIGQSTAYDFLPEQHTPDDSTTGPGDDQDPDQDPADSRWHPYNWMFSFDRAGTDVVSYQYETDDLNDRIRQSGAQPGQGIYSDIADLDHLGIQGVNWGVGYQDYHSPRSHAWLDDTFRSVARFQRFYNANAGIYLPAPPTPDRYAYNEPPGYLPDEDTDAYYGIPDDYEVVADCGHYIDLSDHLSYLETPDAHALVCYRCGTADL